MKTKPSPMLNIKLSIAPDEHLLSAWMRHNLRCGFGHIPFDNCLSYWNLPKQYLKAQRIAGPSIEAILSQIATNEGGHEALLLNHTNARLWSLSQEFTSDLEVLNGLMPRANLESSNLAFSTNWKLCFLCADEERTKFGYCFWHRSHQLPSITHCLKHQEPLYTHDSLKKIDRLVLPDSHRLIAQKYDPQHPDLLNWSKFIGDLEQLLAIGKINPDNLREQARASLALPASAKCKDRASYQSLTEQMYLSIGEHVKKHLFKENNGKYPNVLWQLYSGKHFRRSLINPVYWLVVFYWLREKLEI
jgi:hypothetical protein